MPTKSHNIRIDENIKDKAAALYANLGLNLSDAVNVFLRVSLDKNGFPFPVNLTPESEEAIWEKRNQAFKEFLAFADANPFLEKGYKFNREELYDRKVLH